MDENFFFASGPTRKFSLWQPNFLDSQLLSRTHVSNHAKNEIKILLNRLKQILEVPDSFDLIFVPGSGSGAMAAAFLNFLNPGEIEVVTSGYFSNLWSNDLRAEFKLQVKDLAFKDVSKTLDKVIVLTDTLNGYIHESYEYLNDNTGLVILDAVSGAFLENIEWGKVDVVAFSIQKVLGGDGSLGVLAINSKAKERLKVAKPWPIPKIFNINKWGMEALVNGQFLSTPSVLSLIELQYILDWAQKHGIKGFRKLNAENLKVYSDFLNSCPKLEYLIPSQANRAKSTICFKLRGDDQNLVHAICVEAEKNGVFDIESKPFNCFRFWAGPTLGADYIEKGLRMFEKSLDCLIK
jgi:phosphoserine aminotransferase